MRPHVGWHVLYCFVLEQNILFWWQNLVVVDYLLFLARVRRIQFSFHFIIIKVFWVELPKIVGVSRVLNWLFLLARCRDYTYGIPFFQKPSCIVILLFLLHFAKQLLNREHFITLYLNFFRNSWTEATCSWTQFRNPVRVIFGWLLILWVLSYPESW
jgi:hypothetical protein